MAKGLRNQRLRKFKEMKRQRYAAKELERLKNMLGIVDNAVKTDVDMDQFKDVATVVEKTPAPVHVLEFGYKEHKHRKRTEEKKEKAREVQRLLDENSDDEKKEKDVNMDLDLVVNGKYPDWMHQRKVKKLKKMKKKITKRELRRARQKKKC